MLSYPSARKAAKQIFWKTIVKQVPREMAKRSIPVYGTILFVLSLAVAAAEMKGYKGVKYSMKYGTKEIRRHRSGRVEKGFKTEVKSNAKLVKTL